MLLGYTVTESESWFSGDSWGIAVSVARLHTVIEPESWSIGGSCGIAVSVARLHGDRI